MMMTSKDVSAMLTPGYVDRAGKRIFSRSHHHHHGVFDQFPERADQLGAERAVDRAMIAGQGHAHDMGGLDPAVTNHRTLLAGTDREYRGLRRVDHGGEVIDAVHAEI